MTTENTPQAAGSKGSKNILLMFLAGLAAGSAGTYLLAGTRQNATEIAQVKDSLQEKGPQAPQAPAANPSAGSAPIATAEGAEAKPKNVTPMPGGIDVNGFEALPTGEAVAVSYQEYLNYTNVWAQTHPNNEPSCTWGGRIHKDALNRIINSLPENNPWIRFKFGAASRESRTFIMFAGNLNAQGGSVIYRNGGEPGTFCPIQCD